MVNKADTVIGQEFALGILRNTLTSLDKGTGSIVCISGETGMGKTHLMRNFAAEARSKNNVFSYYVECQQPIGNFNVGTIQPLHPFSKLIENLIEKKSTSAEKKFALNVGMTALATIPLVGEIFYAVKELGRDWRQFKREKSSDATRKISSAAADFYDVIRSYSEKKPFIALLDDMHWADAQSVELLSLIADNIESIPVIFIIAFRRSILETQFSALISLINQNKNNPNFFEIEPETFSHEDISVMAKNYLLDYKPNKEFENWIFEKSYGVPGVITEYLNYFRNFSPFDSDGNLIENFGAEDITPSTIQNAFSTVLQKLTDEERNILALCSAEGREFTAFISSGLMNTDVLTAIKKLKSIQNKSGIIKSMGVKNMYGVKTTSYNFTQPFYQSYLENTLEYEEKVALHGHIATILKRQFQDAENELQKEAIAPYLAAHSAESGDEATARSMLLIAAKTAKNTGSKEVIETAYNSYIRLSESKSTDGTQDSEDKEFIKLIGKSINSNGTENNNDNNQNDNGGTYYSNNQNYVDFISVRRSIVDDFHNHNYKSALEKATDFYNTNKSELRTSESAQILALAIRANVELNDFATAGNLFQEAKEMLKDIDEPVSECFVYNAGAVLKYAMNLNDEAMELLKIAARKSVNLPPEIQLVTLSNISLILKRVKPNESSRLTNIIRKLSSELKFEELASDVLD